MARRSTVDGDEPVVGLVGRVSGTVGPGLTGEVILPIRGGSEAFNAYPFVGTDTLALGSLVTVVEYVQPRTVYVAPAS